MTELEPGWLQAECARAKKRLESVPESYRPRLIRRPPKPESGRFICRCGHPGLGCSCPPRS